MYRLLHSFTKKHHTIKTTEVCKNEVAKNEERDAFFKKGTGKSFLKKNKINNEQTPIVSC